MIDWIKNNKIATALLLVVLFYLFNNYIRFQELGGIQMMRDKAVRTEPAFYGPGSSDDGFAIMEEGMNAMMAGESGRMMLSPDRPSIEPVSDAADRVVIQDSSMSLLVSDVRETGDNIIKYAESTGGFMVNARYNRPDESAFGTISVRVPTNRLTEALDTFRTYAIKVTNENLTGRDVTEQYTDIEARLETLETTKAKFESILDQASEVEDIIQVNQQLIYIQDQIDNLIGQREAIEKNASLTKITVYLSTDELSLPYSPDEKFRPNVVFKLAVRGMLSTLVSAAEIVIWVAVYSVIWVPTLVILVALKRFIDKRN